MKYKYLLFAILSLSIIVSADDILPGGFALPDIQSTLAVPANNVFQIRKLKTAYLAPDATGKLSLTLECGLIGRYTDTLRYSINDLRGNTLHKGVINVKEKHSIELTNLSQAILKLTINANQNSTFLRVTTGHCAVEASSGDPLHLINGRPKMFFRVNGGRLKIKAIGDKPIEHVAITIRDADDQIVFEGNSLGKKDMTVLADVPIADGQAGRIWSVQFSRVPNQGFEDMDHWKTVTASSASPYRHGWTVKKAIPQTSATRLKALSIQTRYPSPLETVGPLSPYIIMMMMRTPSSYGTRTESSPILSVCAIRKTSS